MTKLGRPNINNRPKQPNPILFSFCFESIIGRFHVRPTNQRRRLKRNKQTNQPKPPNTKPKPIKSSFFGHGWLKPWLNHHRWLPPSSQSHRHHHHRSQGRMLYDTWRIFLAGSVLRTQTKMVISAHRVPGVLGAQETTFSWGSTS